jgi:hypothetical protein
MPVAAPRSDRARLSRKSLQAALDDIDPFIYFTVKCEQPFQQEMLHIITPGDEDPNACQDNLEEPG